VGSKSYLSESPTTDWKRVEKEAKRASLVTLQKEKASKNGAEEKGERGANLRRKCSQRRGGKSRRTERTSFKRVKGGVI